MIKNSINCRSIVIPFDEDDYIANGGEDDYEGWLESYVKRYYGEDTVSGYDVNKRIEEIRKQLMEPGISLWDMKRLGCENYVLTI